MKQKKKIIWISVLIAIVVGGYFIYRGVKKINPNPDYYVGQVLDSLNGVYVYYNGGIDNVEERNVTKDGYNIGLKYQCVEFVKRYYYERYKHKMPDSYGNAKDFFDPKVKDGELNKKRDLLQFSNPSFTLPNVGDLLILDGHSGNPYGHVAIVSNVYEGALEVIQQNPGPFASSRALFGYGDEGNKYKIQNERVLGWLRIKEDIKKDSLVDSPKI